MVAVLNSPPTLLFPFPDAAVEACIRGTLAACAADQSAIFAANGPAWEPAVDSLDALQMLIALEKIVGIDLPDTVVPRGGYPDAEACVVDLLGKARHAWNKKHGGT